MTPIDSTRSTMTTVELQGPVKRLPRLFGTEPHPRKWEMRGAYSLKSVTLLREQVWARSAVSRISMESLRGGPFWVTNLLSQRLELSGRIEGLQWVANPIEKDSFPWVPYSEMVEVAAALGCTVDCSNAQLIDSRLQLWVKPESITTNAARQACIDADALWQHKEILSPAEFETHAIVDTIATARLSRHSPWCVSFVVEANPGMSGVESLQQDLQRLRMIGAVQ